MDYKYWPSNVDKNLKEDQFFFKKKIKKKKASLWSDGPSIKEVSLLKVMEFIVIIDDWSYCMFHKFQAVAEECNNQTSGKKASPLNSKFHALFSFQ